jgi:hypothetical protein
MANLLALPIYFLVLKSTLDFDLRRCLLDQWPIWIAAGTMITTVSSWSLLAEQQVSAGWLLIGSILTGGLTFLAVLMLLSYEDVKEICVSFSEILNPKACSL